MGSRKDKLIPLLEDVRRCTQCEPELPLGARPIVQASASSRLLIIGQAPGTRVHASGVPWDDPSGDRLRQWLNVDKSTFYDSATVAIIPMGLCYPGKGKSGDLPPRKECAPLWHPPLLEALPKVELTLLIGQYAQAHYLPKHHGSLTENVKHFADYQPAFVPLPHPSPRNNIWLKKNPWFEKQLVPQLQKRICELTH